MKYTTIHKLHEELNKYNDSSAYEVFDDAGLVIKNSLNIVEALNIVLKYKALSNGDHWFWGELSDAPNTNYKLNVQGRIGRNDQERREHTREYMADFLNNNNNNSNNSPQAFNSD
jgi:hypothetical protein